MCTNQFGLYVGNFIAQGDMSYIYLSIPMFMSYHKAKNVIIH